MERFAKVLKALGIAIGVFAFFLLLAFFSDRRSLFLWAVVFSMLLPLAFWFRLGFKKWSAASLLIALALAASPVDIVILQQDRPGIRLLPVTYGIVCRPE